MTNAKEEPSIKKSSYSVEVMYPSDIEWSTKRSDDVDLITEEDAEGYAVEIVYDSDPLNSRTEYDAHIGTLIGGGHISDEDVPTIPSERELCNYIAWDLGIDVPDEYEFAEDKKLREKFEDDLWDKVFILPVYKYKHGNVAFSTTPFRSTWDSGQVGWIYITKERAEEELEHYKGKYPEGRSLKEHVYHILRGEVKTYSAWRSGEVYGFRLHDTEEQEVFDSCYGYYDKKYCESEAFRSLKYWLNNE